MALGSVEVMVVTPAMPAIVEDLGGAALYPWVFATYLLAQATLTPVWGRLADLRGRTTVYAIAMALFLLGCLGCALAPDMRLLLVARAIQGAGSAGITATTLTLFGDLYLPHERAKVSGLNALVWGVASMVGPPLGGLITAHLSWHALFWMPLLPGLASAALTVTLLPGGPPPAPREQQGGVLALITRPVQITVNLAGAGLAAALSGYISYLPVQVQAVAGGTTLQAGLIMVPLSLAWTLGANLAGQLLPRMGYRAVLRTGALLAAGGGLVVAFGPHLPGLVLYGLGMGFATSTMTVVAQEDAPRHLRGTATSLTLLSRSLGQAASAPALGLLVGLDPKAATFAEMTGLEAGLQRAFVAIAGLATVAAAIMVLGYRPRPRPPSEPAPPAP